MPENESYIQSLFAKRIGGDQFGKDTTIYKFEKIKRAKCAALKANPNKELFDMGVGEPDEIAYPGAIKVLQEEAAKPENRGYTDNGIQEYLERFYHEPGSWTEYLERIGLGQILDASRRGRSIYDD